MALIGIMGVNLLASIIFFVLGYGNTVTVIICNAVQTTCVGAAMVCINSMNADTIEYGEWKTGQRNEGVIPMFFYDLTEEKHAEIMKELASRKEQ